MIETIADRHQLPARTPVCRRKNQRLRGNTVTPIDMATNDTGTPIPIATFPALPTVPDICSNGNALLATGLTFKANTAGALACTQASGPSGSPGLVFTGGTLRFAAPGITSALPIALMAAGGTF